MGRSPTPTSILKLRGSWRAKTRPHEPHPPAVRPPCPSWLGTAGRRLWKELITQLLPLGMLTLLDRHALGRYCELYAEWRQCRDFLHEHDAFYTVSNAAGQVLRTRIHPVAQRESQLAKALLDLEREYGLTPASRAKLGLVPQKPTPPRRGPEQEFFPRRPPP